MQLMIFMNMRCCDVCRSVVCAGHHCLHICKGSVSSRHVSDILSALINHKKRKSQLYYFYRRKLK